MTDSGVDPLLAGLAAGDEEAFEKVHERFAARLFWAALRMLDHRQDAEDAVQQVFADFIRASARLTEVNDLSAYLFSSLSGGVGALTSLILPNPAMLIERVQRAEAVHRVAVLGIAVCRYQARHGRLPAALSDLTPDLVQILPSELTP